MGFMRWAQGGSVNFPGESQGPWFDALVPLGLKALALDPPSDVCFHVSCMRMVLSVFLPHMEKCENNELISVDFRGRALMN